MCMALQGRQVKDLVPWASHWLHPIDLLGVSREQGDTLQGLGFSALGWK